MSLFTAALTISAALLVATAWMPTVKSVYEVGNVADPALNRDSSGPGTRGSRGSTSGATLAAARIATRLEGASRYEHYVDGKWTSQRPGIDNRGVEVANSSAGGQGMYIYHATHSSLFQLELPEPRWTALNKPS
ncbi:hypothetical protein MY3296_007159 [Beauveria thailandica]